MSADVKQQIIFSPLPLGRRTVATSEGQGLEVMDESCTSVLGLRPLTDNENQSPSALHPMSEDRTKKETSKLIVFVL